MKKTLALFALAVFGAGCAASPTPSAVQPQPTPAATAPSAAPVVEPPNVATTTSSAVIDNVLVSDTAGSDSYVEQTKESLSKDATTIFVTAQITAGQKDMSMSAALTDLTDGTKYEPQSAPFTDSGDVQQAFSFINTEKAWPTGDYQATVTLSNGATKTTNFKVE